MNAELQMVDAMFKSLFGDIAKPEKPDIWDLRAAVDAKRDAHVALHTPQLERIYAAHLDHVARAFESVNLRRNPALHTALAGDDFAEIGRLTKAAMQPHFHQQAEDTAEEEAWTIFPDVQE